MRQEVTEGGHPGQQYLPALGGFGQHGEGFCGVQTHLGRGNGAKQLQERVDGPGIQGGVLSCGPQTLGDPRIRTKGAASRCPAAAAGVLGATPPVLTLFSTSPSHISATLFS